MSVNWIARRLADALQRTLEPAAVRLELWDRSSPYAGPPPIGSMVVRDLRTLLGLIVNPHLRFGEAYMRGSLQIRGPLELLLEAVGRLSTSPSWRDRIAHRVAPRNTPRRSRRNVHHHYDLGNDFYRGWLDEQMLYTCAYFEQPGVSLEEAQVAKMDLVCRKLHLRPGETVVEAGCGWGALALHMARHYGVRVKAFNVSREQMAYARTRAARDGLDGQVEFIEDDYRNVQGTCDAFVSVGMLEHVGLRHFKSLASVIGRVVNRGSGRGLLHFIGRDVPRPLNAWIRRRIFPGGYAPTISEVAMRVLEPARMSILDVENLRLHYARTLAHWSGRFDGMSEQVDRQYGEEFRRAWQLYLAGSEATFAIGTLQLFQVVFAPFETPPPYWTRAEINESKWGRGSFLQDTPHLPVGVLEK
jgi:cyclopropane-fatty-acyl-phospholipid synthase